MEVSYVGDSYVGDSYVGSYVDSYVAGLDPSPSAEALVAESSNSDAGYILVYHGSVLLYHSRVPGSPPWVSRALLIAAASEMSSFTLSVSTSNRTSSSGLSEERLDVSGLFIATPNVATTSRPSRPAGRTDATRSGAPFTRHWVPTRTAAAAEGGTASAMRVKSSSFTDSTILVTHEMGGTPARETERVRARVSRDDRRVMRANWRRALSSSSSSRGRAQGTDPRERRAVSYAEGEGRGRTCVRGANEGATRGSRFSRANRRAETCGGRGAMSIS